MASLDAQSKTLQSVYGWHAQRKLHVNRRYQRKLVWTLREKQKLISSILHGYPVPAVLLAERGDGYEIIDGLQRLHTLMSFVETAFPTEDAKYFKVDEFVTAKQRMDAGEFEERASVETLTSAQVATFLDYPLSISIMRGATEDDIDEVFARINTYGHQLSDQERRQAGMRGGFAQTVRKLASELREDDSEDILLLSDMPQISIDLPKMKHGYNVQADQVFWVRQGILLARDLRDSLDEQCIADILASVAGGSIIERSKKELDRVYDPDDSEFDRISTALGVYGADKLRDEFKYCKDLILGACSLAPVQPLAGILGVTNPFPAVFAVIMVAVHEMVFSEKKKLADRQGFRHALEGLYARLNTGRSSTTLRERRKNVDTIKGLISSCFVSGEPTGVYANASTTDVSQIIRRSEIETPRYELKQGIRMLSPGREINEATIDRVVETICAIANCGPQADGVVLIGVADKKADAERIEQLDKIAPIKVAHRWVVGISREARVGGESVEQYVARWKNAIRSSALSKKLRADVLASLDYNEYLGLGVLIINVPRQAEASFVDDQMYVREGDETVPVTDFRRAAEVASRFVVRSAD